MTRKPENKFMDAVHSQLDPDTIYKLKITPVFSSGEPDVLYEGYAKDLFVEYKFLELPKRYSTMIYFDKLLSEKQVRWLTRRMERTANSDRPPPYLAVGCKVDDKYQGILIPYIPGMCPISTDTFRGSLSSAKDIASRILSMVS